MASSGSNDSPEVIFFEIFDGNILDREENLTEQLTQEEREEIMNIVESLPSVNSHELLDFATPVKVLCHKSVNADELDRLACKNNAESTGYQTKWAITVFKGMCNNI